MLFESKIIEALISIAPDFNYVLADRDGTEPAAPYVLVTLFPSRKLGKANTLNISLDGREIVQQDLQVIFRLTLHAKATDPTQDQFEDVNHCLASTESLYAFYQQGINISNVSDLIYTSAPVNAEMYKRASFDITCLTNRISVVGVPDIRYVSVDGKILDLEGNEVPVQFTVNK